MPVTLILSQGFSVTLNQNQIQRQGKVTHLFLEEVSHTLMVAPLLHSGKEAVIELFVDLIELRHFEEDGLDLLDGQDRL